MTLWHAWPVVNDKHSSVINANYRVALGLRSGHLQSVANRFEPRRFEPDAIAAGSTRLVPTDDKSGDLLAVTIHDLPDATATVLLVHGLGGSSESTYVRASAVALLRAGFSVARVDLRSAGASKPTTRKTYHAGKTDDLTTVLRYLTQRSQGRQQFSTHTLAVIGFSLGGAMTLKLLAEPHEGLPLVAGVAVSAPLDLVSGSSHISKSTFGMYERAILRGLRADVLEPVPDGTSRVTLLERDAIVRARNLTDFDNAYTAPRHGWRDAYHYYSVNSAGHYLPSIKVPTLIIHALDDPMIPAASYQAIDWDSLQGHGYITRAITAHGGHLGFHQRGKTMPWYTGQAVRFLARHMAR